MALGSPLGTTLANFFLGNLKNLVFEHSSPSHPKIYFRYVDDVFAVFDDNPAVDSFLNVLNNLHNNIKFTVEKSTASIHFLDVDLKVNNDGTFETCVWRKPTHTGLFLNFNAACPVKWKSGLILCVLHRAKSICSSKNLFFNEVNKLKSFFLWNNYPATFFDNVFKHFLNADTDVEEKLDEDKRTICFFRVPYIDKKSRRFVTSLSRLIASRCDIKLYTIFATSKVGDYFQSKCRTSHALCSNVVCKFTCSCDANLSYVGMSTRHLGVRARKHLNLADQHKNSAIKDHLKFCDVCCEACKAQLSADNFKIVKKCRSDFDTKIQEALYIKKNTLSLTSSYMLIVLLSY